MRTFRIASALNALAIIAAVTVIPSQAQPAQTVQASLSKEAGILSDKFTGLARVMAGKYDWKPGQGVRSVGEVFNLIVRENGLLAGTLTGATGGERPAPVTDPEKLQEALKTSYTNLRQTIAGLSDADLISGDLLFVNQGTLYPLLLRLEQEGAIKSEWGPSENNRRARFYELTKVGRKVLDAETRDWEQTAAIIERFFALKAEDVK